MTRKHFKSIANAIKFATIYSDNSNIRRIKKDALLDELCTIFKEVNNNFDDDKFRKACR